MAHNVLIRANACTDHGLIECRPCDLEETRRYTRRGLASPTVWDVSVTEPARLADLVTLDPQFGTPVLRTDTA